MTCHRWQIMALSGHRLPVLAHILPDACGRLSPSSQKSSSESQPAPCPLSRRCWPTPFCTWNSPSPFHCSARLHPKTRLPRFPSITHFLLSGPWPSLGKTVLTLLFLFLRHLPTSAVGYGFFLERTLPGSPFSHSSTEKFTSTDCQAYKIYSGKVCFPRTWQSMLRNWYFKMWAPGFLHFMQLYWDNILSAINFHIDLSSHRLSDTSHLYFREGGVCIDVHAF